MAITDDDPGSSLDSALDQLNSYAHSLFGPALDAVRNAPANSTPADLAKKQAALSTALQQLSQVESMRNDQRGREGYDAVATLMRETASLAATTCQQLRTLVAIAAPSAADQQRITALTNVLTALSHLSPAVVWQKAPAASGG